MEVIVKFLNENFPILIDFNDTVENIKKKISEKTTDGVHLNEKSQFEMASIIANYLDRK